MTLSRALSFVFVTYLFVFVTHSTAWALEMQPQVSTVLGRPVLSADGRFIAVIGDDQSVRVWEVESGKLIRILNGMTTRGACAQFSRDGERIVASDLGRRALVWRWRTGEVLASATLPKSADSALFAADGSAVWLTLDDDSLVRWDLGTGALRTLIEGTRNFSTRRHALSPDGKLFAQWSDDGHIRLRQTTSGEQLWVSSQTIENAMAGLQALRFSGSGKYLAVGSETGRVHVWEVATGAPVLEG